jgi:hypothetical protein
MTYRVTLELASPTSAFLPHSRASLSCVLIKVCVRFPASLFAFVALRVARSRRHRYVVDIENCNILWFLPRRSWTLLFGYDCWTMPVAISCRYGEVSRTVRDLWGCRNSRAGLSLHPVLVNMWLSRLLRSTVYGMVWHQWCCWKAPSIVRL